MNVVTKYFKTVDLNAENFKEIEKVEKTGDFNVIFVDGSMEVLWKNVYLFKVAYLIFKNWNVIKRGVKLKKEEVSEKKSSHVMRFFEMDVARELAEENPECAIVIDGSLSGMRRRDYEWMREKKIIGLSKETSISIDNLPVPIYLHGSALKKGMRKPWIFYPFIAEKNENVYFWDTMIANFNRKVPAFRIDFLNLNEIDAFKILFYYALNPISPGYPLPLFLVHKGSHINDMEYYSAKYGETEEVEDAALDIATKIYNNWMTNFRGVWE